MSGTKLFYILIIAQLLLACRDSDNSSVNIGELKTIHSKVLNEEREIFVHIPEGFYGRDEHDQKYPVLYVIDGESLFIPTVGLINQMTSSFTANDRCPAMIIVGIPNTNRWTNLSPTQGMLGQDSTLLEITGGANDFVNFFENELMPYIDSHYPTADHRTLIGHSLGGLFTMHVLLEHQKLFDNYICIDPTLVWNEKAYMRYAVNKLKTTNFNSKNMYLSYGNTARVNKTREEIMKDTSELLAMESTLFKFEDAVDSMTLNGLDLAIQYYPEENHFSVPLPSISDGLKHLYGQHHFKNMIKYMNGEAKQTDNLITDIEKHFGELSEKYGYEVRPKESYLNQWAFGFVDFDNSGLASDLLDYNIKLYPTSPYTYISKGDFLLGQNDTINAIKQFEKSLSIESTEYASSRLNEIQ